MTRVPAGLAFVLTLCAVRADAHQGGLSYADVSVDRAQVTVALHVAYTDWLPLVDVDVNHDGIFTTEEARTRLPRLGSFALAHVKVAADGRPCAGTATDVEVGQRLGGPFTSLWLVYACPGSIRSAALRLDLFERHHPGHRTLATVYDRQAPRQAPRQHVFAPGSETLEVAVGGAGVTSAVREFVWLGVEHIFTGFDHVLFLLALLLVATGFADLLKIVTSFTLAHTVTLALATLGYVRLDVRLVESVIAFSIAWVAIENLVAQRHRRRWLLSFGFGLVHGFGFSNVLREMAIPRNVLAWSLGSFNVGVEIGQVAIVAILWPALVWSRQQAWSTSAGRAASVGIGLMGVYWFVERALLGA
jgi:hydrogenase/urease accessory protein HupE